MCVVRWYNVRASQNVSFDFFFHSRAFLSNCSRLLLSWTFFLFRFFRLLFRFLFFVRDFFSSSFFLLLLCSIAVVVIDVDNVACTREIVFTVASQRFYQQIFACATMRVSLFWRFSNVCVRVCVCESIYPKMFMCV